MKFTQNVSNIVSRRVKNQIKYVKHQAIVMQDVNVLLAL